jgi:hypothetical protein
VGIPAGGQFVEGLTEQARTNDPQDEARQQALPRIKTTEFRTCSVKCSLAQHKRRIKSGFWVDAIHADFRYSNGLRYDWPWSFQWPVAAGYKGGSGIPGMGPVKRDILISFVRNLPAKDIVAFASRVRAAELGQRAALATLARIGYSFAGAEAIERAKMELGLTK